MRERGFGAWEGLQDVEVEERFAAEFERYRRGESHGADDAESYESVRDRVRSFVEEVVEQHPDEHVLVVGHGGSLRVVHALAEGLEYPLPRGALPLIENCQVFRCAFRDGKLARID